MFRHVLSFASVLGLALTLTACGNGEPPQQLPRPVMVVHPENTWYGKVNEDAIDAILDAMEEGKVCEEYELT